jgi:fibronectin type 3 domain-containing protein
MKWFLSFCFALSCLASDVKLAWDASPDAATMTLSYRLYAHTNTITSANKTNAIKLNVGTNLTATVEALQPGRWWFAATCADTNGIESDFSNQVTVEAARAPVNMRTVVIQWSTNLTNFYDVGHFRLRIP